MQVVSNVMVQVPFVYVAWLSRYSCFFCFYEGLVHGNTVLPLSETHESKITVSQKPCDVYKWDLYRYVADNLHIPMILQYLRGSQFN